ncbi:MAG: penicillin-binding protein 2, partial [Candidatus Parcubacteria bacterium]|nr:penicillin-binding protein 2 [Candidatus Parcubacteria bacterium]
QVLQGKEFTEKSDNNRLRISLIRPERGVIYDKNMIQLVWNKPSFDLVLDKRDLSDTDESLKEVSEIINLSVAEIKEKIEAGKSPKVLISENLDHESLVLLETKMSGLSGFSLEKNTVRDYLHGPIFSQIIGYLGKVSPDELVSHPDYSPSDYIGKQGLENYYESALKGVSGIIEVVKNALGKEVSREKKSDPLPGKNLVLWIDSGLQEKLYEELEKTLVNTGSKKAAAVALDPKTGGVLAMVSLPSFDNNIFSQMLSSEKYSILQNNPLNPFLNRAISGQYPTGSTIKPFISSAALQEQIIDPNKQIYDQGFIEIQDKYDPNKIWKFMDWKPHGWIDMREAIAVSANVYFYIIGGGYGDQQGLGPTLIKKYLNLFGFGSIPGIDLPGAKAGLIPDPQWKKEFRGESWLDSDTYHMSIGQGDVLGTPLQLASATAAIANGGTLFKPEILKMIIDDNKQIMEEIMPEILNQDFIDPSNINIVKEGMREGVTYGSSVMLNSLSVEASAKTGTAQTSKENYYHNWVTVFAPYDEPEIVLTVIIESVQGEQIAALPVASGVLSWYFSSPH